MRKNLLFLFVTLFVGINITGCSKTWSGVKQDSNTAWKGTKKVVHDATA